MIKTATLCCLLLCNPLTATPTLQAGWGASGLTSLQFNGVEFLERGAVLCNSVVFSDGAGKVSQGNRQNKSIQDPLKKTQKLIFDWGSLDFRYQVQADRLVVLIEVSNTTRLTLSALSLDLLALKLPSTPRQYNGTEPMLGTNTGAPTLLPLDFANGSIVLANDDVKHPLLLGMPWSLNPPLKTIFPVRINTGRESMYPASLPFIDRPVPPGGKDAYFISLRFSTAVSNAPASAKGLLAKFATANPVTLHWTDRRPIGSLIIATAATGWKSNPRGWLLDPSIDVNTADGVSRFHTRLLTWADTSISVLKKMGAQGMITWDIEGEEFPHAVTYVGDPSLCEKLAPEMTGVVDEYFARFRKAGLRVGVTIRPQQFTQSGKSVKQLNVEDAEAELKRKILYANSRWGATLFYIDSNGDPGWPLSAAVIAKVSKAFPNVLLIPEHKNVAYYSVSAPYSESRGGNYSTPALVSAIIPQAFSVINTADGGLEKHSAELNAAVKRGDILMFRGWFDDPGNVVIKAIYSHFRLTESSQ